MMSFPDGIRRTLVIGVGALAGAVAFPLTVGARGTSRQAPELVGVPPSAPAAAFDVVEKTIPELQAAMQAGQVTSRTLVEQYLARIEAYDRQRPQINAMISLNPQALSTAAALDAERAAGLVRGPLHGIPVVLKDNFDTADMPTTGGSIALATWIPAADGFQVRKLREAGAVVIGKTNLHELASGITTISSLGGQTRDPYDLTRNPGRAGGAPPGCAALPHDAARAGEDRGVPAREQLSAQRKHRVSGVERPG